MGQITDKQIAKLQVLTADAMDLNIRMEKQLVEIVNECGGENKLIRTDKQAQYDENGKLIDWRTTIYGHIFDEGLDRNTEERIMAVAVFENNLAVLFGTEYEVFGDMTDEEILELDNWHTIFGGMIMSNATLYNLCENITEYICD